MRKFAVLSVCIVLVVGLSFSSSAVASDEDDVLQVATNFINAFNNNDYKLFYSLWLQSPKTSKFIGGKSGAFLLQGWEAIGKQVKRALNPEYPQGTFYATLHNIEVNMLADNAAFITGYLTLIINPPAVKEQIIGQSRTTLIVQKVGGKWYIAHEHTSAFPTE